MTISIVDFGAKAGGEFDNTKAIAQAIAHCQHNGGGTVIIPAGEYLTGRIQLVSHLTLILEAGAKLIFKDQFDDYPAVKTRWSGYECYGFSPLIYGYQLHNVTIKGEGIVDGQGRRWWEQIPAIKSNQAPATERTAELMELNQIKVVPNKTNILEWDSQFLRPPLLQLFDCKRVKIEGITLQNSPFWNTHLVYCDDVQINGVLFKNPADTPNGDGLDIDSSKNVRVSDCHFDVGDDCLCLKSGINEDGRRIGKPTENVVVTNCTMLHGHGGVVFGSENSGGIKNVTVSNCVFIGTDRGIRLKTNRARGGYIKNISVQNIIMENVLCPFTINSFYRYGVDPSDPSMLSESKIDKSEKTPLIENIQISHIQATSGRAAAAFLYGLPEEPIKNVHLDHVFIEMTEDPNEVGGEPDMVKEELIMAGAGMYGKYIEGLTLHQVNIKTRQGPALTIESSAEVRLLDVTSQNKFNETPVIILEDVSDAYVEGAEYQHSKERYIQSNNPLMTR
ncbi:putative endopolygalacturonase [Bacillus sp. TS-2]|nr:putative endopolygalacturonase [Bacillus sp. TS-2]